MWKNYDTMEKTIVLYTKNIALYRKNETPIYEGKKQHGT